MQPERKFDSIEYLKHGNDKQIVAYETLSRYRILEMLFEFDPIVVGTIPINIDIESSDIDIICYCTSNEHFANTLIALFQNEDGFQSWEYNKTDPIAIVAKFKIANFAVEVFGQDIPTRHQAAYRHMIIEYRILLEKGEAFRRHIVELKRQGMKTEPAFALLLELEGDPYTELLNLHKEF